MAFAMSSLLIVLITILLVSLALVVLQLSRDTVPFELRDTAGKVYRPDKKTADTALMVSAKPQDRYTPAAL